MPMSKLQLTALWFLMPVMVVSCGTLLTRAPVDFAKAKMGPNHRAIAIDGKQTSSDEWADAVRIPFEPKGKAALLWDEKGLYVLFLGSWPVHDPETLCLNVTSYIDPLNCKSARFHMQEAAGMKLVKIVKNLDWQHPLPAPYKRDLVQFASVSMIAKRGEPWSAELFMSWDMVACKHGPRGKVIIHLYRLVIERPTSRVEMQCEKGTQP